ncbi:LysR family transcriptional regulator [Hoeflea sp.]|uniref:LysR family transcriptional regulator n=1 Tax=Hoeflea sp. TaxID=1940281 RepID=UPI003BAF1FB3
MNFASFDLNLLRVLDALLREGSTVAAGQRIGLSQPAVSAALGRLRGALNDELFIRRGQGLEPTLYAKSLEIPLREMLDGIEQMFEAPKRFDPAIATASFKISGSDFFAELLMPRLADMVSRQAPDVRVQLVNLVPDSYVDTIEHYEVDLALIPAAEMPDWAEQRPVFRSRFCVIARSDHPRLRHAGLNPGDTVPIDLFCDLGHVLFSPEGKLRAMGDAALARVGRERRVAMTMPVFSGVYRAVSESDLIALIPYKLAVHVADRAGLSIYEPPMPVDLAQLIMVWHKRTTASPGHRWLRDCIADIVAPLDDGPPAQDG